MPQGVNRPLDLVREPVDVVVAGGAAGAPEAEGPCEVGGEGAVDDGVVEREEGAGGDGLVEGEEVDEVVGECG